MAMGRLIQKIVQLSLILLSTGAFGQVIISGQMKDYHTDENLSYIDINADSIPFNRNILRLFPPDTTIANKNGYFIIKSKDSKFANLTFSFIGYVSLSLRNIPIEGKNQQIDLGDIYLPYLGEWFEGYSKNKEGKDRKTIREERKAWKKYGMPNSISLADNFLFQFQGMEDIMLEYPINGPKKHFKLKNGMLIIDYAEFIKQ